MHKDQQNHRHDKNHDGSPEMQNYFHELAEGVKEAYSIAESARVKNFDPENKVDIVVAKNMAERVEGLLSILYPQLKQSGITEQIQKFEEKYGALSWRVALKIALSVAKQSFCKFSNKKEAMEAGIRAGFTYHTLGIVSAPLEGFIELKIKKRSDNKEYFALSFAGPIRGAGGTGASVCVLIGDYIRKQMGYAPYDPTQDEINRFITELEDYHERITNLQYHPSEKELDFLIRNLPVEVDGDPSERIEVSNYKDLPRVETNKIRSGVCLVVSMLALKAPKMWKRLAEWGDEFGLEWGFIEEFLAIQKKAKARSAGKQSSSAKITPNYTYISDLVAGRPILSNPMASGGFRLRYGRSRVSGFSSASIHPATARFLDEYVALGTQLKVERPGKAAAITFCDELEGPIVKLTDGSVFMIKSEKEARLLLPKIAEILYLGDILFSYGDFSENGHVLVPAGYCPEWYVKEFEKGVVNIFGTLDLEKAASFLKMPLSHLRLLQKSPITSRMSIDAALRLSSGLSIPLYPEYTYFWNSLSFEDIRALIESLMDRSRLGFFISPKDKQAQDRPDAISDMVSNNGFDKFSEMNIIDKDYAIFSLTGQAKRALELLGFPHVMMKRSDVPPAIVDDKKDGRFFVKADFWHAKALLVSLGFLKKDFFYSKPDEIIRVINFSSGKDILDAISSSSSASPSSQAQDTPFRQDIQGSAASPSAHVADTLSVLDIINSVADITLRDKAGTFIGARMGRPEKAKQRRLKGSPHSLFPVGEEGGRLRSFQAALEVGKVSAEFPLYRCDFCNVDTLFPVCESCGRETTPKKTEEGNTFSRRSIDINHYFKAALKQIKMTVYPDLIKGVRGTSNKDHTPEHLAKGILRAKHGIYVNKDGTTRYDMIEVPITHFKPKEIGTSIKRLIELGYTHDHKGDLLENEDQILELKPQDIILPNGESTDQTAKAVLSNVGNFIDDLLKRFYGLKPFYNLNSGGDLVGALVIGLAPHISAGLIGRIIGFSKSQGCFAHPLWHAGLRRDCDGDEACVMLLLDGLLNFSSKYLPNKRGAQTMDAPLVLTTKLVPSEVDDMVHGMDVVFSYPLELYEAAMRYKYPWEVEVEQLKSRLHTPYQYEKIGFTHDTKNINIGVLCSAYKTIPTMEDKLKGQMGLAVKIRAVDPTVVASLVIEKHFLKDTRGNLRKFSQQQFRCVKCNEKYRRPPLRGTCTKCGGKLIFTVSEGFVTKYMDPSISLAKNYNVSPYLKQTLDLTKRRIEGVFGRDKEKQESLGKWFG